MDPKREAEQRERYVELLGELRTILPGAQVLFAFLLTVPFAARFGELDALGKALFVLSLAGVTAATALFLAPAAYHRLADRRDRRRRLRYGVRTALLGLALLGLSMACAVFVVVRFVYDTALGTVAAGLLVVIAALTWYLLPIIHRRQSGGKSEAS